MVSLLHASNSAHLSLVIYEARGTNTRWHPRMNRFLLRSKVNAASKVKLTPLSQLVRLASRAGSSPKVLIV